VLREKPSRRSVNGSQFSQRELTLREVLMNLLSSFSRALAAGQPQPQLDTGTGLLGVFITDVFWFEACRTLVRGCIKPRNRSYAAADHEPEVEPCEAAGCWPK
jgi:hypothetical protein